MSTLLHSLKSMSVLVSFSNVLCPSLLESNLQLSDRDVEDIYLWLHSAMELEATPSVRPLGQLLALQVLLGLVQQEVA